MNLQLTPRRILGAAILASALWIVHGFIQPMLAACVIAIASWPLYLRFAGWVPRRLRASAAPVLFTAVVTLFVLAPMVFAAGALLSEAHALLAEIAAGDSRGIPVPGWLQGVPVVGPWAAESWRSELAHPQALLAWTRRADPAALLGWAQSLGQFTGHHVLVIGFTILLLAFLYRDGQALAGGLRRAARHAIGESCERYVELAARGLRASVASMLAVGLFVGLAAALAYAIAGAPRAGVWAAITGLLAAVPFLGYVAVLALALRMAVMGLAAPALASAVLGCAILLCGDKVVRPAVARSGLRLPFAWVLMGCLGGFEVLGLVGLVIGPVLLRIAAELWKQRARELEP
jgi:predicted PurR-regulated permease PerM